MKTHQGQGFLLCCGHKTLFISNRKKILRSFVVFALLIITMNLGGGQEWVIVKLLKFTQAQQGLSTFILLSSLLVTGHKARGFEKLLKKNI